MYYRNEDVTECYTLWLHSSLTLKNKAFTLLQFHNCPNMKPVSLVIDIESTVPVLMGEFLPGSWQVETGSDALESLSLDIIRHCSHGYLLSPPLNCYITIIAN